jgi:hypothetical protein
MKADFPENDDSFIHGARAISGGLYRTPLIGRQSELR